MSSRGTTALGVGSMTSLSDDGATRPCAVASPLLVMEYQEKAWRTDPPPARSGEFPWASAANLHLRSRSAPERVPSGWRATGRARSLR